MQNFPPSFPRKRESRLRPGRDHQPLDSRVRGNDDALDRQPLDSRVRGNDDALNRQPLDSRVRGNDDALDRQPLVRQPLDSRLRGNGGVEAITFKSPATRIN